VAWSKRRKGRGKGGRHPFKGPQWEGSGRGVWAMRMPRGAGRAWGLVLTGGRRPDRPRPGRGTRGRTTLSKQGCAGLWRVGPDWQREGEERRGGPPGRKKRSAPSPDEQESFCFIQIKFKLLQIVLLKRWTYQAPKI
jgi:hypothetical protein